MSGAGGGVLVVGQWRVSSTDQQQAAVNAAADAWETVQWPAGLLSYTALAGDDAATVLHLSRWRDRGAAHEFAGEAKTGWSAEVDRAVPGLDRQGVQAYLPYDGLRIDEGQPPGCLVLVDIEAADAARARAWMDAMLALGRDEQPPSGMLSATFHLSTTGTRVVNYAEWIDAAAHRASVAAARSAAFDELVGGSAGARPVGFTRSTHWRTITSART